MRFSWLRPRLVPVVSASLALALACAPSGPPPHPPPSGQLGLPDLDESAPAPFQLIHFGPTGEALADPTIQLAFNRPLRALGTELAPPSGLRVLPAVAGAWHWVGTHGLTFAPASGRLPRATAFQVEVPASLTSVSGESLGEAKSFSFVTPRPALLSITAGGDHERLGPRDPVRLVFSAPVDAKVVGSFVRVVAKTAVPVNVVTDRDSPEILLVVPRASWPKASTLSVEVAAGWVGSEGPEKAVDPMTVTLTTYGPPRLRLTCDRDPAGRCRPDGGFAVELDTSVDARALSRAVRAGDQSALSLDTDWWEGARTSYLALSPKVAPGQTFSVVLAQPLLDIYGQSMTSIEGGEVLVGDYRPTARIGFEGQLLLPTVRSISVHGMNAPVTVLERALSLTELTSLEQMDWARRYEYLDQLPRVRRRELPRGTKNRAASLPVDLDALLAGGSGAFAVGVRYPAEDGRMVTEVKTGQRSRLGLSVKRGRDHGVVWVTSTDTGAPLAGARVQVLGGSPALTTDAFGLATLGAGQFASDPRNDKPEFLEVRAGAEVCVLSSRDTIGPWRLGVPSDFWSPVSDQALVFAERDLFRPGESAWIKGYLRRPSRTGSQILPAETLTLTLTSPDGEVSSKLDVRTNSFGAFSGKVQFPLAARVGGWTVTLARGKEELAWAQVAVRMYRPAEFEVRVTPSVTEISAGERVDFRVSGQYFFGGAMAGRATKLWVTRNPEFFVPKGADGWQTSDEAARHADEEGPPSPILLERAGALDGSGLLSERVTAQLPGQLGPERVTLEAEVTDVSRQALAGRASVLVHPASYYLGLREDGSSFLEVGRAFRPSVVALTPEGQRVPGRKVELELVHLRWTEVEQEMDQGYRRTVRSLVRETVSRCQGSARGEPLCDLVPSRPGQYVLRAKSRDDRGRSAVASTWYYALGSGTPGFRDDSERGTIELTLDRKLYRPGESARLLVQSPFPAARAWLTLEREGVLSSRVVDLRGPTPVIEIPVTEELGPNVFVGVHLLEDRTQAGTKARPLEDSYRFGYASLELDPELRRLDVELGTDKKEYRPRDEVELSIAVKDGAARARAAEVAVFVVDEGVLSLSGYQLPDPVLAFAGARPLRVETIEGREGLARLVGLDPAQGGNKGEPGGDGGDARSNFLTAAFFHPGVVTDASGRAKVSFRLPDNLGRFRVMAMAVTDQDRYGTGRTELTVHRPLMARPALPRFLRVADSFQAAVVIDSQSPEARDVEVALTATGATLSGATKKNVRVPPRGSVLVEFPASVSQPGPASFTFSVSGAGVGRDVVTMTRPVQLASPIETVAAYGHTDQARAERLGALDRARPDVGGLDVSISSSALVGLEGSFEKLEEYPYSCTEQLSSRLLPLVAMQGLAERFSIGKPDQRSRAARHVADILARQRGDGGFGLWPESLDTDAWVSGYALFALAEARRRKIDVPELALQHGRRYLEAVSNVREPARLPEAVLAAFVLGRLGHPDVASLQALFDVRRQMPIFARALLLWGLAESRHGEAAKILERELETLVTLRGNRAEVSEPESERWLHYLASNTRLHALVLAALVAANPKTVLAPPLVRSLLEARRGGAWPTTQETAFSLLALEGYAEAQEKLPQEGGGSVFVGDRKLGQVRFELGKLASETFHLPMSRIRPPADLVVAAEAGARLFYEARLRFALRLVPTEPVEQGFVIERTLRPVDPVSLEHVPTGGADQVTFSAASLVLSEVTVLVPSRRRFVVVDDPLPAGLEAVDFHLSTSAGSQPTTSADGYSYAWFREEMRDDRVLYFIDDMPPGLYRYRYLARATTPGKYVTPPSRVMEMYQEEVFGRTGARTVEVR